MAELKSSNPIAASLPLSIAASRLEALEPGSLTSISPLEGLEKLREAFEAAQGFALPEPGKSSTSGNARCLWFGRSEFLLVGPVPDAGVAKTAAIVDQSDAWYAVALSGASAEDVLARLVPLDIRQPSFPVGATARTQLQHMNVSLTRLDQNRFMILAFRSLAGTLVHDLKRAMEGIAARG